MNFREFVGILMVYGIYHLRSFYLIIVTCEWRIGVSLCWEK